MSRFSMDIERFIELGKNLGYEKEELQKFVKEQKEEWRENERLEREERLIEREEKEKEREEKEKERKAVKELAELEFEKERMRLEFERQKGNVDKDTTPNPTGSGRPKLKLPVFQDGRDDMDIYLTTFERLMTVQKYPESTWSIHLGILLTGRARDVYARLSSEEASNYNTLKNALLHRYDLTEEGFRLKFRGSRVQQGETYSQFLNRIISYVTRWIKLSGTPLTYDGLFDLLLREQIIFSAGSDLTLFLKERVPENATKMVELADRFLEARKGPKWRDIQDRGVRSGGSDRERCMGKGRSSIENRSSGNSAMSGNDRRTDIKSWQPRCFVCDKKGHVARDCQQRKKTVDRQNREVIGCCAISREEKPWRIGSNIVKTVVSGNDVTILRDSGCSTIAINRKLVPESAMTGETGIWKGIDGVEGERPWCRINIDSPFFTGTAEALVFDNPIFDIVIGNISGAREVGDPNPSWNTLKIYGTSEKEDVQKKPETEEVYTVGVVETRSQKKVKCIKPLKMTEVKVDVMTANEIQAEQKEDVSLKKVFELATLGKEKVIGENVSRFIFRKGILMREFKSPKVEHGKAFTQLVVPSSLRTQVMKVGHENMMAGHLGTTKTLDRIQRHFYWPGMQSDVRRFCQSCDKCQKTIPKGRVGKVPLGRMPLIDTPFQRVAVDLVGPIDPMSERKYRYILTIVDYATRYPEAIPLQNIDAVTVAEALISVFSRVGMPTEILTDMGTQFTSGVMKEVGRLLSIKQMTTTPYHPMCNGLVERFNATLKSMLKKMCSEQPKEWDRYIDALLFAYREAPQESLGFSPFELLYGRTVRGPIQILRELWMDEAQEEDVKTTYQYVIDLRERLEETCSLAQKELEKASTRYRKYYDTKAKDRQFKVNDKVLLLLPESHNKLLMKWKGPFDVVERLGKMDYRIKHHDGKIKTYHANLLKEYKVRDVIDQTNVGNKTHIISTCVVENDFSDAVERHPEIELPVLESTETWTDCHIPSELTEQQKGEVREVLEKYDDVLTDKPGLTNLDTFSVKLTSEDPVRSKPYPTPHSLTDVVKKELDEMLKMDVIESSNSAYASPIVLVKKKEGTFRFCIDYRKLNRVVVFDAEPIPNIEEMFTKLSNAVFFSKLDLTKGYWQIPVKENERDITAFVTPHGLFRWKVMPFGIVSAPAVFTRMMRKLLNGLNQVVNYIDDILIYTETWEEHVKILELVLERLRKSNLTAKPSKCFIAHHNLEFLGHVIQKGEVMPEESKVQKILKVEKPKNKKQMRSFLGLIGYYQKFIPNFSAIAAPLTDLTKKGAKNHLEWNEPAIRAFERLKDLMSQAPILKLPNLNEKFIVRTDASGTGVGAVMLQEYDGKLFPIRYLSRKLKPRETRYPVVEQECLAIVWAIGKLKQYLYGKEFILETDHKSLTWMNQAKMTNSRVLRWALSMQPFRYVCRSIRGVDNVGADLLSRCGDTKDEGL